MQTFSGAAPGTSAYFPSCISRIRDANPELPIEPVILQSILLCLVAGGSDIGGGGHLGRKNLILRTREEDIGTVLNLAILVSYLDTVGLCTMRKRYADLRLEQWDKLCWYGVPHCISVVALSVNCDRSSHIIFCQNLMSVARLDDVFFTSKGRTTAIYWSFIHSVL